MPRTKAQLQSNIANPGYVETIQKKDKIFRLNGKENWYVVSEGGWLKTFNLVHLRYGGVYRPVTTLSRIPLSFGGESTNTVLQCYDWVRVYCSVEQNNTFLEVMPMTLLLISKNVLIFKSRNAHPPKLSIFLIKTALNFAVRWHHCAAHVLCPTIGEPTKQWCSKIAIQRFTEHILSLLFSRTVVNWRKLPRSEQVPKEWRTVKEKLNRKNKRRKK